MAQITLNSTGVASNGALVLQSNGTTTAVTIDTSQNVTMAGKTTNPNTISVGGATPSASGAGITFPAAISASSDVNTLDDYEEGTFTPTIQGITTAGTGTYGNQLGTYTKIGNRVLFTIYLSWTAHTGTGFMIVSNLPFTITNNNANYAAVAVYLDGDITLTAGKILQARTSPGSSQLLFTQYATGGTGVAVVTITNTGAVMLSGNYYV